MTESPTITEIHDNYTDTIDLLTKELDNKNERIVSMHSQYCELMALCDTQEDRIENLEKERDDAHAELYNIAEQIGVCGAEKCSADCSAPDCFDIGKGIKHAKDELKRFEGCVPVPVEVCKHLSCFLTMELGCHPRDYPDQVRDFKLAIGEEDDS